MRKWKIAGAFAFTLACYTLFLFTKPVYLHSDNVMVAVIVNGLFGGNNVLCQYLHPLFSIITYSLAQLFPTIDAFTLLVHITLFFMITLLAYLSLEKQMPLCFVSLLFLLFFSQGLRVWNANYTIQTGAILFGGSIILFSSNEQSPRKIFAGTIILCIGFMLRTEVTYLFLPYIILEIIIMIAEKKSVRFLIPAITIICLLIVSKVIVFSLEPYASADEYNQFRTITGDFPMRSYSSIAEPAVAREDYQAAVNWILFDTDHMNKDLLQLIATDGNMLKHQITDISSVFKEIWALLTRTDIYFSLLVLMTGILFVYNLIFSESTWQKVGSVLAVLGSFIILYYFTCLGRAPFRIWEPVMFGTDIILLTATKTIRKKGTIIFLFIFFAVLWYGTGQMIAHLEFITPQNVLTATADVDDSTYNDDGLYIWPNWHGTIPKHFIDIGKLPTQKVLEHNIALGDWTYGQPYYQDFLDRIGAHNPANCLIEGEHCNLIGNSKEVLKYINYHYGNQYEFQEAGITNGYDYYRVVKKSE